MSVEHESPGRIYKVLTKLEVHAANSARPERADGHAVIMLQGDSDCVGKHSAQHAWACACLHVCGAPGGAPAGCMRARPLRMCMHVPGCCHFGQQPSSYALLCAGP